MHANQACASAGFFEAACQPRQATYAYGPATSALAQGWCDHGGAAFARALVVQIAAGTCSLGITFSPKARTPAM